MQNFEVPEPIINSPYVEPESHWHLEEGKLPEQRIGRRPAGYYYRDPRVITNTEDQSVKGQWVRLQLVNLIRERLGEWKTNQHAGASRTSLELMQYWERDGRDKRLFFAQIEAAKTIIFLTEARSDFLQGIQIPFDELSDERKADGLSAFRRYACKMATGAGKTTVMGMLAAWSILNKVHNRGDARFSDAILVVCPNVTIRNRLQELNPLIGQASIYQTRDLVPQHLRPDLTKGKVVITNWHIFEPQTAQTGGARVVKAGILKNTTELIHIGSKSTVARGKRYLTLAEYQRQVNAELIRVVEEVKDELGNLTQSRVQVERYIESDASVVKRVIGKEIGGKQNILVFNDEAHHAYRIAQKEPDDEDEDLFGEQDEADEFVKEATVWVDGLDRIHKLRGINFCVDLSATPYYLGRVGQDTNKTFPWVVSDFGLTDAIESGLVKIPQLAVRDTTGNDIPGFFNIWHWIMPKLTPAERGGRRANPKPEAILKYANHPIAMLAGLWKELFEAWSENKGDQRPPVFILVCKNTKIAKLMYEWIGENKPPATVAPSGIKEFFNTSGSMNTIRVDSKVVHETDTGEAKSAESRWMRLTLDTVGKTEWPRDRQGNSLYPEDFEELAKKLARPLHPPGRDVRCIVSVGMLTEGWDCSTVTHIVGLRPFMSQLLCEQVVGRGLRRRSYELGEKGRMTEEVAKIFGVPFEVIPFKANQGGPAPAPEKRWHVQALAAKQKYEIRFPRVEGYRQGIRNRVSVDWLNASSLTLDPLNIPPEVEMKAHLLLNSGRPTLYGPGRLENVSLNPYRSTKRFQELVFDIAASLTREYVKQSTCEAPAQVLFPQMVQIATKYLKEKVNPIPPAEVIDVFLSPYYGWVIERLVNIIRPDTSQGESPEVPILEGSREDGSTADVDYWTTRQPKEVIHSHLNYVVPDTKQWEQAAAYMIDTHPNVFTFVKNAGLGFSIPYINNGESHDYQPDFIIKLNGDDNRYLIIETKGFDDLAEVKVQAAKRWVNAVNADGRYGYWLYEIARKVDAVKSILDNL